MPFSTFSRMTKREQWTWLAGILEGEGSFSPTTCGYGFRVSVAMTDKDTMNSIATLINLKRWPRPGKRSKHKRMYYLEYDGQSAVTIARKILPFMHTRRRQKIQQLLRRWYRHVLAQNGLKLSTDGRRISLDESRYIV